MQMHDFAARQTRDGWILDWVPHGGSSRIHLLDEQRNTLRCFNLAQTLPDFSRFAHWTTAGMWWSQEMLAYFTPNQRHLVVRAWWGARLVMALDSLQVIDPSGLNDDLHAVESEIVLRELRRLVARIERGEPNEEYDLSTDAIHYSVGTLAHFPGLLKLHASIPLLRVLEERAESSGECHGSFNYSMHSTRHLAQLSLRRLGEKPLGYPVLAFTESEEREPLRQPQPGPIDGAKRHTNLFRIRKQTPLAEVYELLGAPDEIGHHFWRFDVDAEPPYTLLLWLGNDDAVERIVKYVPPFWTGPNVFPSQEHSLLGSDSTTVGAFKAELEDGTFIGLRLDVDVLQEMESSQQDPVAALARAILAGNFNAIAPLADALEEAEDPRARVIKAWLKA